jgi:hypothetical protein
MSECFHVKFSFSGFIVLKNKIFKWPHPWLILACWFWRRFFKIFCVLLLFRYYLTLEMGYPLPLETLESSSFKGDLYQVWLKLAHWFWRRFLNDPTPFLHSCDYHPLKSTWPFIWTNLNSLHPRIICTKFDWFWPADSGEEDFYKFSVYFYSFAIISPCKRAISFILNKFESPWPKDDLCQV